MRGQHCIKYLKLYGSTSALAISLFFVSNLCANPVVSNVASGQVSIQQTPTTTTINQSSQKAIINWQSFNINHNETTHFQQPAGGVALNRISPTQGASQIYGSLTATGQIILINPAGIYFGPSAYVNVGGLIATTANLTDQDFLNSNYRFSNQSSYAGSIINEGQIIAAQNGMLALVGSNVTNNGIIHANLGHVILASGEAFTLNFSGDNLINFTIDQPSNMGRVSNTGIIYADGGTIQISSMSASQVLDNAINLEGVVQAKSVYQKNGKIIISGNPKAGVVRIAGKINATGNKGGRVEITGYNILLDAPTEINVSGTTGGGSILIGGNYQGKGPLPNANAVVMMPTTTLLADATDNGNGGEIILWSDNVTKAYGSLKARGGAYGGDGGFIETSGHYLDVNNISVNTSAPLGKTGSWLLDPTDLTLSNSATSNVTQLGGTFTADNNSNTSNLLISTIITQLASTAVTVLTTSGGSGTGNGDITVANDISWTTANSLTLSAYRNLTVNGNITSTHASARLTLKGNNEGAPAFTVGSGNGVVTVNGTLTVAGPVDIYYNPSAYSSPTSYTNTGGTVTAYMYVNVAADVSLPGNSSNTNSFALSKNIDMTGTPHSPIATFNGTFDGQGFAISNITMNAFISSFGGTIKNLGFVNPTVFNTISGAAVFALGGAGGFITDSYVTGGTLTFAGLTPAAASFIAFPVGGSVTNSTSSLTITGTSTNSANIGGIIGGNAGTVSNSSFTGSITLDTQGAGTNNIGGICGDFCTISNSFSTGSITVTGGNINAVGGISGASNGLTNSYSTMSITINGNGTYIGGGVGRAINGVSNSYSTGNVVVTGTGTDVGGFLGSANSSLSNNFTSSNVTVGSGSVRIGGFSGSQTLNLGPTESYSTGTVTAPNSTNVGGFIGLNESGTFSHSNYTTSRVLASGSTNVGGYVGNNQGTMTNFYSTGIVTGTTNVGGAVGVNTGTISNAYWDMETSGQATSAAGSGRTTAQMFTQSNYNTWSFPTNWSIAEGKSYPYLTDAYPTGARAISGLTGAGGDVATQLAVAGVNFDTVNTGANGFFYFLEGNNAYSGIDKTIADNTAVLIYLNNGSSFGNVVIRTPSSGASITGLSAAANFIGIGSSDVATFSITDLTNAKGSLSSTNILYSTSGNNITVGNASHTTVGISTTATSTFSITGNLSPFTGGSASMTFSGPVSLSTTPTLDAGVTGVITITGNITGNSNALIISNGSGASTSSISGALGNSLTALTKNGTGVLNISGTNNTYTGTTTLNNGTLEIGVATNALGSNTLTLNSGTLRSSLSATLANNYTLGGNVAIGGSNNLTLSGLGSLNSGNTLSVTNTATTTLSGNLSGTTSGITENTTGTLLISGADNSSYGGTTTLTAGTLQIGAATNALGTGGLTINGGNLQSTLTAALGNNMTVGGTANINGSNTLTLNGTLALNSGTFNILNTATTTFNGNFSSNGTFNAATGTGTIIVASPNNGVYSGTVAFTSGTLQVNTATNALGTGLLQFQGGTLTANQATVLANTSFIVFGTSFIAGSNDITISGAGTMTNPTLTITNTGTTTLSGNLVGNAGLTINPTTGTVVMSGADNSGWSGGTVVSSGTLRIGATSNALGTGVLLLNDGNLQSGLTASIGNNYTIGGSVNFNGTNNLTLTGSGTLNNTLFVTNTANAITLSGALGSTGGITQNGNGGTLILSNSGNNYSGSTTITAGTLQLGAANVIPNTSDVSVGASGLLEMNSNSDTIGSLSGAGNVNMAGATLTTANNASTIFSGVMSGTGGNFVKGGSGTFTVSGNQTYTGSTTISAGTIALGVTNALPMTTALSLTGALALSTFSQEVASVTGAGTVNNAGVTVSNFTVNNSGANVFAGTITGNTNLIKSSAGALILNSANTYTGSTTINAGSIVLGIANALPITTTLTATGILELANFAQQVAGLSGAGTIMNSSGSLTNFTVNNSSASSFSGGINGNINLVKSATGVFTVSGSSNYAGSTSVNGGTLQLAASNILPNTTDVTLAGVAIFDLNNASETIGSIAGSGSITLGSGNLTTNNNSSTTFSGSISGTGGFAKNGSGTLIFSGTNNYSGSTIVNGGTLQIDSAQGLSPNTSNSSVNTGATLAINNVSVNGGTFLLDGGTLNGIGNASFNAPINLATNSNSIISANAGATFAIAGDVNGASDLLMQGAGAITITGNVGDVTRLNSVTTNSSKTITGSVYTTGNQNYGHDINLINDVTYDSNGGSIIINNPVNGGFNLIINSNAATTFAQAVGSIAPLANLTVDSSLTNINGGSVITLGMQTYHSSVVLGANTQLTGTTLALNSGVIGGTNLTMNGTTLAVTGTVALNDFNAIGTGGNNTLTFDANNTLNWVMNGTNSGTLSSASIVGTGIFNTVHNLIGGSSTDNFSLSGAGSIAGNIDGGSGSNSLTGANSVNTWIISATNGGTVTGVGGSFSNMQTLNGGSSNDNFTLAGGSAGSINGGAGTDSLTGANVATTWMISGTDTGSLPSVSSFNDIQNITGGNADNTFIFADNAVITGILDGGSLSNTTVIDYTAYSTPITVQLGADIFEGNTINQSATVTNYVNINSLFANRTKVNLLNMPQKMNQVVMTGALDGFVNDPLFFNGFTFFTGATSGTNTVSFNVPVQINYANHTAIVNGVTMTFINFNFLPPQPPSPTPTGSFDVSRIIQQPNINAAANSGIWINAADINTLINMIYSQYDDYLRNIRINPYCYPVGYQY